MEALLARLHLQIKANNKPLVILELLELLGATLRCCSSRAGGAVVTVAISGRLQKASNKTIIVVTAAA